MSQKIVEESCHLRVNSRHVCCMHLNLRTYPSQPLRTAIIKYLETLTLICSKHPSPLNIF